MLKKILVLNTGGTIAMSVDDSEGVKPMDDQAVSKIVPFLERYADITMKNVLNLPSPHMTPTIMNQLRLHIEKELAAEPFDGIVITHGTDTLEETAYFLDLTLPHSVPVVVTGAMRSSNELGADGPVNLISSVRTAADPDSHNKGVLVVFNDEIHAACHVTKTHTSNVATFQSPQFGPIGTIAKKQVHYHHAPLIREHYAISHADANVPLIKAVAGMDPSWLQFLLEQPIDGLVIEAFGLGNLPPAILPTLKQLLDKGVPIVLVSRCYNGQVQDVYDYEGGGRQLKELGIIFSNGLNGQKARLKLIVTLQQTRHFQQLQHLFDR
ncbi:asparaginase [Brevibacillus centrosporus]|uniref:asparaginase n=1 Tax=Brevibacillus centrosporus TaxID=54910 RepID=A0A1I3YUG1_9BACL|nr:asparaginase [Brevibacillus centrosporus]MED4910258.1 asparaginase [Brevibacillus centrosporus]SFK35425.1 asparaginase [Brevibacillus centrosporus]